MQSPFLGRDVSVVIPTIPGRDELLVRAVHSVKAQIKAPAAVIIENDVDRHGAHWARNKALERVGTHWVAWLDDDDEMLPNHLMVLLRGAHRAQIQGRPPDMVFTYAEFIGGRDPLGCVIDDRVIPEPVNVPFDDRARASLRAFGNFIPVTYMVRAQLVRDVGGFPAPYSFDAAFSRDCEDYGLLLRMLDAGARFHHVCGVRTWRYYFHETNTGGRGADRLHELEDV
jgi:glycosyltransferase involved in cell wall biosynthesis